MHMGNGNMLSILGIVYSELDLHDTMVSSVTATMTPVGVKVQISLNPAAYAAFIAENQSSFVNIPYSKGNINVQIIPG